MFQYRRASDSGQPSREVPPVPAFRRPATAQQLPSNVGPASSRLSKITIVCLHPELPMGRSRISVYPNRFRNVADFMAILQRELRRGDGSQLGLSVDTHELYLVDPTVDDIHISTAGRLAPHLDQEESGQGQDLANTIRSVVGDGSEGLARRSSSMSGLPAQSPDIIPLLPVGHHGSAGAGGMDSSRMSTTLPRYDSLRSAGLPPTPVGAGRSSSGSGEVPNVHGFPLAGRPLHRDSDASSGHHAGPMTAAEQREMQKKQQARKLLVDVTDVRDLCRIEIAEIGGDGDDNEDGEDEEDTAAGGRPHTAGKKHVFGAGTFDKSIFSSALEASLNSIRSPHKMVSPTSPLRSASPIGGGGMAPTRGAPSSMNRHRVFKHLLTHHGTLVCLLSSKLSIESEITSLDLVHAEKEYATTVAPLTEQLTATKGDPATTLRTMSQLCMQLGKAERGLRDEQTLAKLKDELYAEKEKSLRLERDLDVAQHQVQSLTTKLEDATLDFERRRAELSREAESFRLNNQKLVKEVNRLTKIVDNLQKQQQQMTAGGRGGTGAIGAENNVGGATSPDGRNGLHGRPKTAPKKSVTGKPQGADPVSSALMNLEMGSLYQAGSPINDFYHSITSTEFGSLRTTDTLHSTPTPQGVAMALFSPHAAALLEIVKDGLVIPTQFVSLSGETHAKSVQLDKGDIRSATAQGLLALMRREFTSILRAIESAKGVPRKQVMAIQVQAVTLRTAKEMKVVELSQDSEVAQYLLSVRNGSAVQLLCLESDPSIVPKTPVAAGGAKTGFQAPTITLGRVDSFPNSANNSPDISPSNAAATGAGSPLDGNAHKRSILIKSALTKQPSNLDRQSVLKRNSTHNSLTQGIVSPSMRQNVSRWDAYKRPTPLFSTESLGEASHDPAVIKATYDKLISDAVNEAVAASGAGAPVPGSKGTGAKGAKAGLAITSPVTPQVPAGVRRSALLKYLRANLLEFGEVGQFERVIDTCLAMGPRQRPASAFAAIAPTSIAGPSTTGATAHDPSSPKRTQDLLSTMAKAAAALATQSKEKGALQEKDKDPLIPFDRFSMILLELIRL